LFSFHSLRATCRFPPHWQADHSGHGEEASCEDRTRGSKAALSHADEVS
jgi:hypothetical protein